MFIFATKIKIMAKTSGTTRNVGSGSAAQSRTFYNRNSTESYAEVGNHFNAMRDSLNSFAQQNGWNRVGDATAWKNVSDTDNIRSISISVGEESNNGTTKLYYETRIFESATPRWESRDRERYLKETSEVKRYDTIEAAYRGIKEQKKRLDKMVIR